MIRYIIKRGDQYVLEKDNHCENTDQECRNKILSWGGFLPPIEGGWQLTRFDHSGSKVSLKWYNNFGFGKNHLDNHLQVFLNIYSPGRRDTIYIKSHPGVIYFEDLLPYFNLYLNKPSDQVIQDLYDIGLQKLGCYRNIGYVNGNNRVDHFYSIIIEKAEVDIDKPRVEFLWAAFNLKRAVDTYDVSEAIENLLKLEEEREKLMKKIMEPLKLK